MSGTGILKNLQLDELTRLGTTTVPISHNEMMGRTARFNDPAEIALTVVTPHETVSTAGENLNDGTGTASTATAATHAYGHPIAVEDGAHFRDRKVDVIRTIVGNEETKTVPVGRDGARDDVELVAQAIFAAAIDEQLARNAQCLEAATEIRDRPFAVNTQRSSQRGECQRHSLLAERIEQGARIGDRVAVRRFRVASYGRNWCRRAAPAPLTHERHLPFWSLR